MIPRRVLCATDLSDAAGVAVREADRRARWHGADLVVVHVLGGGTAGAPMTPGGAEVALLDRERLSSEVIEAVMDQVTRETGRAADSYRVVAEDGAPEEAIRRTAEAVAADLLVLGSTGKTGLARLLGGTAERVLQKAASSVLVAKPSPSSNVLLAATDLSPAGRVAIEAAAAEARARQARLVVLHGMGWPAAAALPLGTAPEAPVTGAPALTGAMPLVTPANAEDTDRARQEAQAHLAEALVAIGIQADVVIASGPPEESILETARAQQAEVLFVGAGRRTGLDRLLLGSVAADVVRRAPCSVLVARA
jgi:nucleotide-binding universal stress UspA family protein